MKASIVLILSACGLFAGQATAHDYKPAHCPAAMPYEGKRAPPMDLSSGFDQAAVPEHPVDSETRQRLASALQKAMLATHATAMTVAVASPDQGQWQTSVTSVGDTTDRLFFWASAGKTLTAVAILQLAEKGRLSLSDPVSNWVGDVPNGDAITLGNLLNHTSGLFSANEDLVFNKTPHRLSLGEEVKILNRHGAMFCPGQNWRYSNSGYALLGEVLEKIEGKSYAQIVTARVLDRLGLKHMRMLTPADDLADVMAPVSQTDQPAIDPRQPGAAGGVVASAADMTTVWEALLGGRLLKLDTVRAQFAMLYPMFGQPQYYGQGVMVYVVQEPTGAAPATWLGHSGGAPGVKSVVAYSLKNKTFVAVAMTGDGSAEATAALLLRQLH